MTKTNTNTVLVNIFVPDATTIKRGVALPIELSRVPCVGEIVTVDGSDRSDNFEVVEVTHTRRAVLCVDAELLAKPAASREIRAEDATAAASTAAEEAAEAAAAKKNFVLPDLLRPQTALSAAVAEADEALAQMREVSNAHLEACARHKMAHQRLVSASEALRRLYCATPAAAALDRLAAALRDSLTRVA